MATPGILGLGGKWQRKQHYKISKRATANSPYDGITREVVETKGTAASRLRKTDPNRSIAKSQTKSRLILTPDAQLLPSLFKNEGDSGDIDENKGTENRCQVRGVRCEVQSRTPTWRQYSDSSIQASASST